MSAKKITDNSTPQNPQTITMELVSLRFPHITDQIFEILNNRSLTKCRKVHKTWLRFIDDANYPWSRILKKHPMEMGQTPFHIAAKTGQLRMWELFLNEKDKINLPKDDYGITPLHLSARYGHLKTCKLLMKDAKDKFPQDH